MTGSSWLPESFSGSCADASCGDAFADACDDAFVAAFADAFADSWADAFVAACAEAFVAACAEAFVAAWTEAFADAFVDDALAGAFVAACGDAFVDAFADSWAEAFVDAFVDDAFVDCFVDSCGDAAPAAKHRIAPKRPATTPRPKTCAHARSRPACMHANARRTELVPLRAHPVLGWLVLFRIGPASPTTRRGAATIWVETAPSGRPQACKNITAIVFQIPTGVPRELCTDLRRSWAGGSPIRPRTQRDHLAPEEQVPRGLPPVRAWRVPGRHALSAQSSSTLLVPNVLLPALRGHTSARHRRY